MPRYWVVGAIVSGQDMSDDFIARGFWFGDREDAQGTINQIVRGDRIAIKSMLGQGSSEVAIKAIGIVSNAKTFAATPFQFFYVDWLDLRGEERRAPFAGFGGTVHNVDGKDVANQIFRF